MIVHPWHMVTAGRSTPDRRSPRSRFAQATWTAPKQLLRQGWRVRLIWLDTPSVAWQEGPAMMMMPGGQAFHGLDLLFYVAEMTAAADRGGRRGR